jgi:hypothetical protein
MVGSTRNKDYNDPSVQNQGAGQQAGVSNQARASQHFDIEVEFRKLQRLVQAQAKEIADLKEQQRKGKKKVVVKDDPEKERAEKHTQENPEMRKKIITMRKRSNGNPHLKGIRMTSLKIRKGSWKYGRAVDMKGPHTNPEWRGPIRHLSRLGSSNSDNLPATKSTWRRISWILGILTTLSHPRSCHMLYLMDSNLRRN